jgi:hypothetical protein
MEQLFEWGVVVRKLSTGDRVDGKGEFSFVVQSFHGGKRALGHTVNVDDKGVTLSWEIPFSSICRLRSKISRVILES